MPVLKTWFITEKNFQLTPFLLITVPSDNRQKVLLWTSLLYPEHRLSFQISWSKGKLLLTFTNSELLRDYIQWKICSSVKWNAGRYGKMLIILFKKHEMGEWWLIAHQFKHNNLKWNQRVRGESTRRKRFWERWKSERDDLKSCCHQLLGILSLPMVKAERIMGVTPSKANGAA